MLSATTCPQCRPSAVHCLVMTGAATEWAGQVKSPRAQHWSWRALGLEGPQGHTQRPALNLLAAAAARALSSLGRPGMLLLFFCPERPLWPLWPPRGPLSCPQSHPVLLFDWDIHTCTVILLALRPPPLPTLVPLPDTTTNQPMSDAMLPPMLAFLPVRPVSPTKFPPG